jgi:hypothetical protein
MHKRDFFRRLYETVTLSFTRLYESSGNEFMFAHNYFKQLCTILAYVQFIGEVIEKQRVFVTSNKRMVKKSFFMSFAN